MKTTSKESYVIWENLKPSEDFIFAKMMRNEEICKGLIEVLLDISIERIEYLEEQKTIDISLDSRSVRLDVYLKDENGTVYNVEIQPSKSRELAKRSRYYQAMIDLNNLEKGQRFSELPDSYVIFICTYDPVGEGKMCYRYENRDVDSPEKKLGDGTCKYFFNTKAYDEERPKLTNVLKFIETGDEGNEPTVLAGKMAKEYQRIKLNKEWMVSYMTLYEREQERLEIARQESYEEGKEEGKKEGLKEGRKEGRKAGLDIGLREGRAEERANMLKSVKTMMEDGISVDYLKKMMKLTEEEVIYVLKK